jgi:hypothetical protein
LSPVWQEEKLVWILPTSFPNAWDSWAMEWMCPIVAIRKFN